MVVANQELAIIIAEVHAVAFAVAEHFAIGTFVFLHPITMAVFLETIVPNVPETILVDVALMVVGANAGAS